MRNILLSTILILFLTTIANAALTEGTNAGFVTTAPTADPVATSTILDTYAVSGKFTSPNNGTVSSVGWYCDNATQAANFQVGIYAHDAANNRPGALLATSGDIAKGTTAGWKTGTISLAITAGTIYWIAVQLDDTATTTNSNYATNASYKEDYKSATALPSPWGTSDGTLGQLLGIYALYTPAVAQSQYKASGVKLAGVSFR